MPAVAVISMLLNIIQSSLIFCYYIILVKKTNV